MTPPAAMLTVPAPVSPKLTTSPLWNVTWVLLLVSSQLAVLFTSQTVLAPCGFQSSEAKRRRVSSCSSAPKAAACTTTPLRRREADWLRFALELDDRWV